LLIELPRLLVKKEVKHWVYQLNRIQNLKIKFEN